MCDQSTGWQVVVIGLFVSEKVLRSKHRYPKRSTQFKNTSRIAYLVDHWILQMGRERNLVDYWFLHRATLDKDSVFLKSSTSRVVNFHKNKNILACSRFFFFLLIKNWELICLLFRATTRAGLCPKSKFKLSSYIFCKSIRLHDSISAFSSMGRVS